MPIDKLQPQIPIEISRWLGGLAEGYKTSNVLASSGNTFSVQDPGAAASLVQLEESSAVDVSKAISQARSTFNKGDWSKSSPDYRSKIMHRIADLVERDSEFLTTLEAIDTGKPRAEAAFDIDEVVMVLRYYAGWCDKVTGDTIPTEFHTLAMTLREPLGVCAAITPWNYPLPILMYKLAPAIAMGNSFVAKPSELAPLSAIYFATLCEEAGLPSGVVQLVIGAGSVGAELVHSPGLDKIAFTGSTRTGLSIMAAAAKTGTKVSMELGGKSPQVVFNSADIEKAVEGVARGIWTNAGQVCIAGSRLIVQREIKSEFLEALLSYANDLVLGHALEPRSTMGPIISHLQRDKIQVALEQAKNDGAEVQSAGSLSNPDGYFVKPTIVDGLASSHPINAEEIFGPVLSVSTFDEELEAIELANSSRYGLAAGVWSENAGQSLRVAKSIEAGTVWVNTFGIFHPTLPFGGKKASGFGRELGPAAIDAYTETKTIVQELGF